MSLYFLLLALVLQSCCLRADAAVEDRDEKQKGISPSADSVTSMHVCLNSDQAVLLFKQILVIHFPVFHFISVRKFHAAALPEHVGDHEQHMLPQSRSQSTYESYKFYLSTEVELSYSTMCVHPCTTQLANEREKKKQMSNEEATFLQSQKRHVAETGHWSP